MPNLINKINRVYSGVFFFLYWNIATRIFTHAQISDHPQLWIIQPLRPRNSSPWDTGENIKNTKKTSNKQDYLKITDLPNCQMASGPCSFVGDIKFLTFWGCKNILFSLRRPDTSLTHSNVTLGLKSFWNLISSLLISWAVPALGLKNLCTAYKVTN